MNLTTMRDQSAYLWLIRIIFPWLLGWIRSLMEKFYFP